MALIDVLLPVRNGMPYLRGALDSVLAQSERDWRLLVLDHGSSDGSGALIDDYAARDRRIERIDGSAAQGLSGLLNLGLARCDGRYMMRLDADDLCLPERMALTLAAFASHPAIAVVSGQAQIIDGQGSPLGQLRLPPGITRLTAASLFRNPISHPALTVDLERIHALGAAYGRDFLRVLPPAGRLQVDGLAEDYFMFGQLALLGLCLNLPQRLIRYRWHPANVSQQRATEQLQLSLKISRYLASCFCTMRALPPFDPAPFCNHGGQLFELSADPDHDKAFLHMAATLRRALGSSLELERELAFRHTLAQRRLPVMLLRYRRFRRRHAAETGEWHTIRSWLLRHLPGRALQAAA